MAVARGGTIEKAADAFSAMDFEKALDLLERALSEGGKTPGELVRIYSLRAQSLALLGRLEQAREAFRIVLSIDPAFRLPPDASPRLTQPFSKVLAEKTPPLELRLVPGRISAAAPPQLLLTLIDPLRLSGEVTIYARWAGRADFVPLRLAVTPGNEVQVQLSGLERPGPATEYLEYYAELYDRFSNRLAVRADAAHPLRALLQKEEKPVALPPAAPLPAPTPAWYSKWWVWAIVGTAIAAGGGVAAGVILSRPAPQERDFGVVVK